ncbi:hypothetical protein CEXT_366171 [Caerostris extrusa]|uniref:Uncharacterized protein n=1 Tax=Caerostris extrusa TaxID=172846 RepID=A0AAV4NJY1_CAEEX|nr:hypothetical protein CEXT_366171 [Caerostris extrusa]
MKKKDDLWPDEKRVVIVWRMKQSAKHLYNKAKSFLANISCEAAEEIYFLQIYLAQDGEICVAQSSLILILIFCGKMAAHLPVYANFYNQVP